MKVTVRDLEEGTVARLTPREFSTLYRKSVVTIGREIRKGIIKATVDTSGRIFITRLEALRVLCSGEEYKHDSSNVAGINKITDADIAKDTNKKAVRNV